MKKTVKRIVALLLVTVLCLGFTGCKELDRARAHHAFLQEDGSLLLDGVTYVPLPYCEELTPPMGENVEVVTVTKPDVPVLLKNAFAEGYFLINEERTLLGDAGVYYCLEEEAAQLTARIMEGFTPEVIAYTYPTVRDKHWIEATYTLTEVQKNAVRHVLASVSPREAEYLSADMAVILWERSADGWFGRELCELYAYNGLYSLVVWDKEGMQSVYDVPHEMNDVFAGILSAYRKEGM